MKKTIHLQHHIENEKYILACVTKKKHFFVSVVIQLGGIYGFCSNPSILRNKIQTLKYQWDSWKSESGYFLYHNGANLCRFILYISMGMLSVDLSALQGHTHNFFLTNKIECFSFFQFIMSLGYFILLPSYFFVSLFHSVWILH